MKRSKVAKRTAAALALATILTVIPVMSVDAEALSYEDGDTISETDMEQGATGREYTIGISKTLTTGEASVFDQDKIAAAVTNGSAQAVYNASGSSISLSGATVSGTADVTVTYPAASGTGSLVIYSDCGSVVNTPESVSVTTTNDATVALSYDFNNQAGDGELTPGTVTLKYYYSATDGYYWGDANNSAYHMDPANYGVTNIQHAVVGDQLTITTYWNGVDRSFDTQSNAIKSPLTVTWSKAYDALTETTTFRYDSATQSWSIVGGATGVNLSDYGINGWSYNSPYTAPNDGDTITYLVNDTDPVLGTVVATAPRGEAISYDASNAVWNDRFNGNTAVFTYAEGYNENNDYYSHWICSDGDDYYTNELQYYFGITGFANVKSGDQITITRTPATYSVSAGNGQYDSVCDVLLATIRVQYQLKQSPIQPVTTTDTDGSQNGAEDKSADSGSSESGTSSVTPAEKTYNSVENTGNGETGSAYNGPYKADTSESKGNLGNHTSSSAPTSGTTQNAGEQVSGWSAIAGDIDSKIESRQLGKTYTIEMNGSTRLDSSVAVKLGQNKVSALNLQLENSTSVKLDPRIFVTNGKLTTVKTADGKTANLYLDVTANTTRDVRSGKIDTQFIPYSVIVSMGGDISSRMVAIRTNNDIAGKRISFFLTKTKKNATKVTLYSYDGRTGKLKKVGTVKYGKDQTAEFPVSLANYNFVAIEE